jgi:hypothetical protein
MDGATTCNSTPHAMSRLGLRSPSAAARRIRSATALLSCMRLSVGLSWDHAASRHCLISSIVSGSNTPPTPVPLSDIVKYCGEMAAAVCPQPLTSRNKIPGPECVLHRCYVHWFLCPLSGRRERGGVYWRHHRAWMFPGNPVAERRDSAPAQPE